MSNSRELSELASQLTVQGDLITLPNLQILGSINTSTLDVSGNFSVLGNVTIGNAGTDTFTINSAITYTETLTGGTGVINIGSGQLVKDAAGNLGLGVTPSAWGSTNKAIQIGALTSISADSGTSRVGSNFYIDNAGVSRYLGNPAASVYSQNGGQHLWFTAPSGTAGNAITFTQAMTLTQGGNLLVGTTIDAAGTRARFQDGDVLQQNINAPTDRGFSLGHDSVSAMKLGFNNTASTNVFGAPPSTYYLGHVTANATVFTTGGSERARITSGGNLSVGTTAETGARMVVGGTSSGALVGARNALHIRNSNASGNQSNFLVFGSAGQEVSAFIGNDLAADGTERNVLSLGTAGTERARITSGGYFKASNTGTYASPTGSLHEMTSNVNSNFITQFTQQSGDPFGLQISYNAVAPNNTSNLFLQCIDTVGTKMQILSNGNLQNLNNSYGAISDAKLKENVVDASSYLDRFMQVRFRNFNFIGSDLKQFGVIAQELEQVFPGLVDESPDFEQVTRTRIIDVPAVEEVLDEEGNVVTPAQPATTREEEYTESVPTGTFTKSVKYSVLAQMQGKVIQELNDKIVNLEDQLQQVLTRLSNLENK